MKDCVFCGTTFEEKVRFEKYCSIKCCKTANGKRRWQIIKNDPEKKKIKSQKEIQRRHLKRQLDPETRRKHNEEEKARYRKKNGIETDLDLKCAPKGSGTLTKHGYRQIIRHGHPNARKDGQMFEHVFVMSELLNRPLTKTERVHHKNGIKSDNGIKNLELWDKGHAYGQRVSDKINFYKEFLEFHGFSVIKKM